MDRSSKIYFYIRVVVIGTGCGPGSGRVMAADMGNLANIQKVKEGFKYVWKALCPNTKQAVKTQH